MAAAQNRTSSFKVVLLGEGCVGKTSLVLRYVEDKFNDKHYSTLQVRGPSESAFYCHQSSMDDLPPGQVIDLVAKQTCS